MKRILLFIMAITFSLAPFAQNHTAQKKPVRKTAVTAKKKAATPARKTNSRSHCKRIANTPIATISFIGPASEKSDLVMIRLDLFSLHARTQSIS